MHTDERIARIARGQHALVASWQLTSARVTPAELRSRLRSGALVTFRRGVYAVAGAPLTPARPLMAAVLAAGPGAVASHDSGLWHWGLLRDRPDSLEVTTDFARRVRAEGIEVHRTRRWLRRERSHHQGVPVTSVARTLCDVASRHSPDALARMVDDALRRRILRLDDLRFSAASLHVGPGRSLAPIHEVLAARLSGYEPAESELEAKIVRILVDAGLPEPQRQLRIEIAGRRCRVDLGYRRWWVTIECDSWTYHGQRRPFDGDRARGNELVGLGYAHLQFTDRHSPEHIVRTTRAALLRKGCPLGAFRVAA